MVRSITIQIPKAHLQVVLNVITLVLLHVKMGVKRHVKMDVKVVVLPLVRAIVTQVVKIRVMMDVKVLATKDALGTVKVDAPVAQGVVPEGVPHLAMGGVR